MARERFNDVHDAAQWLEGRDRIVVPHLDPSVLVRVTTMNSTYLFAVIEPTSGLVAAKGGKILTRPTLGHISGSTFGGSMIVVDRICHAMHLEFTYLSKRFLLTTPIRGALVESNLDLVNEMITAAFLNERPEHDFN